MKLIKELDFHCISCSEPIKLVANEKEVYKAICECGIKTEIKVEKNKDNKLADKTWTLSTSKNRRLEDSHPEFDEYFKENFNNLLA